MSLRVSKSVSKGLDRLEPGAPVVLLLHGYAADEQDLPSLMSFLPGFAWASLRAPVKLGHEAFSWYPAVQPLTPAQADLEDATDVIWQWVDDNLPADSPLIVLGFSQGGLMATQLLRTAPHRISAAVILAGFIIEGIHSGDENLKSLKPKVFYGRGAQDERIPREAVKQLNIWLQAHTRAQTKNYEGLVHSIDDRVMNDVANFLANT